MVLGDYKDIFKHKRNNNRTDNKEEKKTFQVGVAAGVTSERRKDVFMRYYNTKNTKNDKNYTYDNNNDDGYSKYEDPKIKQEEELHKNIEKQLSYLPQYGKENENAQHLQRNKEQSELNIKDTGITEAFFDTQEMPQKKEQERDRDINLSMGNDGLPLEYQKMRKEYEIATFISEKCEILRRKLEGIGSLEKRQAIIRDYLDDLRGSSI